MIATITFNIPSLLPHEAFPTTEIYPLAISIKSLSRLSTSRTVPPIIAGGITVRGWLGMVLLHMSQATVAPDAKGSFASL